MRSGLRRRNDLSDRLRDNHGGPTRRAAWTDLSAPLKEFLESPGQLVTLSGRAGTSAQRRPAAGVTVRRVSAGCPWCRRYGRRWRRRQLRAASSSRARPSPLRFRRRPTERTCRPLQVSAGARAVRGAIPLAPDLAEDSSGAYLSEEWQEPAYSSYPVLFLLWLWHHLAALTSLRVQLLMARPSSRLQFGAHPGVGMVTAREAATCPARSCMTPSEALTT